MKKNYIHSGKGLIFIINFFITRNLAKWWCIHVSKGCCGYGRLIWILDYKLITYKLWCQFEFPLLPRLLAACVGFGESNLSSYFAMLHWPWEGGNLSRGLSESESQEDKMICNQLWPRYSLLLRSRVRCKMPASPGSKLANTGGR